MKQLLFLLLAFSMLAVMQINISGCAQILSPTGGPRDTIPPKLLNANPREGTTNFHGNRISLNFDEYIQLDQVQQNVIVSPTPKLIPNIDYKLKSVTIKLKDTLLPNTTYSINFGNALKDLNEGNPFRKYTYVFSTGPYIDSLEYSGKVIMAETGRLDSTLQVYLYKNAPDSAIEKRRPDYISNLDSLGNFSFSYLPYGTYKVYAIKDGDGSKTYNSTSETFAFLSKPVILTTDSPDDTLYAYTQEKEKPRTTAITPRPKADKNTKLKISSTVPPERQDLLKPFTINFSSSLKKLDFSLLQLSDTLFHKLKIDSAHLDSTGKILNIYTPWEEDSYYTIVIPKEFATDTLGISITKSDTLKFKTKRRSDYGSLKLQFKNIQLDKNPVLQFIYNNNVVNSYPITSNSWSVDLFTPNEYELRVLYDTNKNGIWDPGNYKLKRQPEKVINIPRKVTIRPNFDSDIDIDLK